jgi:hypothetical protein
VEGVVDNPDLSASPDLFGFHQDSIVWAFICCYVASHVAHYLIDALRYARVITPTVAPEHFCDYEVIVKALVRTYVMAQTRGRSLFRLRRSAPCWSMYSM